MTNRKKRHRTVAVALFALGVAVGLALSVGGVWADLEASMFDRSLSADGRLSSLKCPTIMTSDRPTSVSAVVSNSFDREIEQNVRVHISAGFITLMREERAKVSLAPGERERIEWPVTADDAAYGRLIFVRAYQFPKFPEPDREASCGILVLNVPVLTGGQIVGLSIALSTIAMAGGIVLWHRINRPLLGRDHRIASSLTALAVVVIATIALTLLEFWIPALGMLIVATLMIGGIIAHFRFGT